MWERACSRNRYISRRMRQLTECFREQTRSHSWLAPCLRIFDQFYCQHIARRAVQYVIGSRAQQQRQAMTAVAADHDQVTALFLGQVVDFLTRLAVRSEERRVGKECRSR